MSTTQAKSRRKKNVENKGKAAKGPSTSPRQRKGQSTAERLNRRAQSGTGQFIGAASSPRRKKVSARAQNALREQAKKKQGGGM